MIEEARRGILDDGDSSGRLFGWVIVSALPRRGSLTSLHFHVNICAFSVNLSRNSPEFDTALRGES